MGQEYVFAALARDPAGSLGGARELPFIHGEHGGIGQPPLDARDNGVFLKWNGDEPAFMLNHKTAHWVLLLLLWFRPEGQALIRPRRPAVFVDVDFACRE